MALDAGHRHPPGGGALVRHACAARKPALAGVAGPLRRGPRSAAQDPRIAPMSPRNSTKSGRRPGEDYQSKLGTFRDLTVPWIRRIFVVGLGMAVINQISGVNAIMYYGTSILSSSGFGDQGALLANVVNGVTSVVAVIVGMSLMTRVRRKSMLIVGLARHGFLAAGHRPDLDADPGRHPPRLPGAAVHGDVPGVHAVLHRHGDLADDVRNLPAARPRASAWASACSCCG